MKLKKIAALALAGVMAVSMLAGCAGKGTDDKKDPTTGTDITTTLAADVATEMGKLPGYKDKMTVSSSASLKKNLDSVVAVTGTQTDDTALEKYLPLMDTSLVRTGHLPTVGTVNTDNYKTDSTVQKTFGTVVFTDATSTLNEKGVLNGLMSKLKSTSEYIYPACYLSDITQLPAKSGDVYNDTANNESTAYHFEFTYTMDVAVSKVEDAASGATTYVAAYVVTRTPAKVAKAA